MQKNDMNTMERKIKRKIKSKTISCLFRMTAVLVLFVSGSCQEQEERTGQAPLCIGSAQTSALPAATRSAATRSAATRAAGTQILNKTADAIGLFLKESKAYDAVNNRKYSYATPFWITGQQLLLSSEKAMLAAYYPYSEAQATPEVTLTSHCYDAADECYYLPFTAAYINTFVNLNLRRAYALIRFSLIRGEKDKPKVGDAAYLGDGEVSSLSFTANLIEEGMLNLFTGSITGESKSLTLSWPEAGSSSSSDSFVLGSTAQPAQKDFLIVPCAPYNGDLAFSITVDGREMSGKVSAAALCGSAALQEGVMYEIKLVVRPTELIVSGGLPVKGWESTDIGEELENK